ncbi:Glu-tRNA(Gln) amidotransferase subunit GatD [Candidatus Woesearchaeota archaeon]|nr:Glu-tRNA(Gln) amidotransferase subunit GatD [Candidatus Woesearchaeota archaeon]
MAKAGDKVKVFYKKETIEGVLMPEEDSKFIFVKLDSGYNIGLKKSLVKKIDVVKVKKSVKSKSKKIASKKGLPKISILNTGGTITSKVDYSTGAVTAKFTPEEVLELFPAVRNIANIDAVMVRNIMSENMRFDHYNLMAKAVEKEVKKGVSGVIIAHGTDTLHYSSAALSFALEGINIPVVFVGSQRSSDRPSTDSLVNLVSATMFITQTKYKGVFLCMHENNSDNTCIVSSGTKVRKMHTSRRDAFRPINTPPVAIIDYEKKKIKKIAKEKKAVGKFQLKLFNPKLKVGMFKFHTNIYAEQLEPYKKFDALLLEAFALGQAQIIKQDAFMTENMKIGKLVKELARKMPVAVASQCIYGRIDMNVYSEGRELQKLGVIGNYTDMTPETAFIKLAWLLSNHKKNVRKLFSENIRGEISERSEKEGFLV